MGLHAEEVYRQAWLYRRAGYEVQADHLEHSDHLEIWTKPDLVNGRRPDVIAIAPGPWPKRIIVEVESFKSVHDDRTKDQVEAFERAARECPNTEFRLVVIYSSNHYRQPPEMLRWTSP